MAVRREETRTTVDRYPGRVRVNHWITAISLILLAISGAALFHPALFFLSSLFGSGSNTRFIHPWIGVVLLAIYNYVLAFGESAADKERLSPWIGMWLPMVAMYAFSIFAFWTVNSRPRDNFFTDMFGRIERGRIGLTGQWRRLRGQPAT